MYNPAALLQYRKNHSFIHQVQIRTEPTVTK